MPTVLLVRHGQASFGEGDYDRLSELGRRQAEMVGRAPALRGLRRPGAVHGSLRRQRDTARLALASAGLGTEATLDPRWDEYDHLELVRRYAAEHERPGPRTSREFQLLLDAALARWVEHGDEGGWPAFAGGAIDALGELVRRLEPGQDAMVFTSAGTIAAICADLLGASTETVVALNRVGVNGAITKLVAGRSGVSLLTFNEHSHVDPAGVTYR
jgi:broad specificity phosphatase PhoE